MKHYPFVAAIGLVLGFAMVWWVRPDTNAGTIFIVVACTLFCFVAGVALTLIGKLFGTARGRSAGGNDDVT